MHRTIDSIFPRQEHRIPEAGLSAESLWAVGEQRRTHQATLRKRERRRALALRLRNPTELLRSRRHGTKAGARPCRGQCRARRFGRNQKPASATKRTVSELYVSISSSENGSREDCGTRSESIFEWLMRN